MLNTARSVFDKLNLLGGIAAVVMAILMTMDVIARYALNTGITDSIEMSSMLLGIVTCLALPHVTEHDEHIRFTMLTDMFSAGVHTFFKFVVLLISTVTFGLLTWGATARAIVNIKTGEYTGALQLPLWPTRMLFAASCLVTLGILVYHLLTCFQRKKQ